MDLKSIRDELRKLSVLVGGWHTPSDITALERELALDKLRKLYDDLRFGVVVEERSTVFGLDTDEVDIDLGEVLSLGLSDEEDAVIPRRVASASASGSTVVAEVVAPQLVVSETPVVSESFLVADSTSVEEELSDDEERNVRHRHKQRVIMSLYDTTPPSSSSEQAPSEVLEPSFAASVPQVEVADNDDFELTMEEISLAPNMVLGDVMNHDVQTLADSIVPQRGASSDLSHNERVVDLRKAIGINDKFLLIRDLFNGDGAEFDVAIGALNDAASLDDCMIFIAENYSWNSNSDGAKLLMELLERKFS